MGRKAPKSVSFELEQINWLSDEAERSEQNVSEIVREAVDEYREQNE